MKFFIFFALAMVLAETGLAVGARGRMYNSNNVIPSQFPSLVRLEMKLLDKTYTCSGTLIRKDWVLTAAHCMLIKNQNPASITVFMGSNKRGDPLEKSVKVVSTTEDVIRHPEFNKDLFNSRHNDIALIKIPKIQITENIKLATLPRQKSFVLQEVQVAGWGNLFQRHSPATVAQWNNLTVYAKDNCPTKFELSVPSQMCVYKTNVSICGGDSGGPAYYGKQVVGVASVVWGEGCESNNAMIFTKVVYFNKWINGNIRRQRRKERKQRKAMGKKVNS